MKDLPLITVVGIDRLTPILHSSEELVRVVCYIM
jgi:hypothetical protein